MEEEGGSIKKVRTWGEGEIRKRISMTIVDTADNKLYEDNQNLHLLHDFSRTPPFRTCSHIIHKVVVEDLAKFHTKKLPTEPIAHTCAEFAWTFPKKGGVGKSKHIYLYLSLSSIRVGKSAGDNRFIISSNSSNDSVPIYTYRSQHPMQPEIIHFGAIKLICGK